MNDRIEPGFPGDWWLVRQKAASFFDFGRLTECETRKGAWTFHVYGRIETTMQKKQPYAEISFTEPPVPMDIIFAAARAMDFSGDIRRKSGPTTSVMFEMNKDEHMVVRAQAPQKPKVVCDRHNCEALFLRESDVRV